MFFFHPMWNHESERIGKMKCTPVGYALHVIADLLGTFGLILLLGTAGLLGYLGISGSFRPALLIVLTIPVGVGAVSEVLHRISWKIAKRKGFEYDDETCEASWIDEGERVSFRWKSN
jgi:hypothetical protein